MARLYAARYYPSLPLRRASLVVRVMDDAGLRAAAEASGCAHGSTVICCCCCCWYGCNTITSERKETKACY
jgi:hypothetical protein